MRVLTIVAIVVIGLVGFAAITATQSGADAPEVRGLDRAALESQGVHLGPPSGKTPKVTPEQAIAAAGGEARGKVQETILASFEAPNVEGGGKRDVIVVSYDPATVIGGSGPAPMPGEPAMAPSRTVWAVAFVDAQTGEFIFGFQEARAEE